MTSRPLIAASWSISWHAPAPRSALTVVSGQTRSQSRTPGTWRCLGWQRRLAFLRATPTTWWMTPSSCWPESWRPSPRGLLEAWVTLQASPHAWCRGSSPTVDGQPPHHRAAVPACLPARRCSAKPAECPPSLALLVLLCARSVGNSLGVLLLEPLPACLAEGSARGDVLIEQHANAAHATLSLTAPVRLIGFGLLTAILDSRGSRSVPQGLGLLAG
mmetsp:Transcript_103959/g.325299  ORF Transcript_103959/g.325299 Transcript_103959/m.325299 type:complete len:217 (-) Transcript_103959:1044-1694(-)